MKRIAVLTLACAALAPGVASADLIVNGSFEDPAIASGSYAVFGSIPGWTTSSGPGIEIQNHIAGSPFDGNQLVELDSDANSGMYQDVATVIGQTYHLSFAYSARPGIAADSTGIDVSWGGAPVTSLALSGVGASDTSWQVYSYDLLATSSTTRLQFDATGISDSYGGYLDGVSLRTVPEPGSLALCGIGVFIGLMGRRRIRRNAA